MINKHIYQNGVQEGLTLRAVLSKKPKIRLMLALWMLVCHLIFSIIALSLYHQAYFLIDNTYTLRLNFVFAMFLCGSSLLFICLFSTSLLLIQYHHPNPANLCIDTCGILFLFVQFITIVLGLGINFSTTSTMYQMLMEFSDAIANQWLYGVGGIFVTIIAFLPHSIIKNKILHSIPLQNQPKQDIFH